ncbi:MAG: hypothetical protein IJ079_07220 [Lachnospiraceae bacterium]|nr:hypothetical protein [Lachnospiraceae bacterium]
MNLLSKRILLFFVIIGCISMSACGHIKSPQAESVDDDEREDSEEVEIEVNTHDYQAVDDFLISNLDALADSQYTQIESEEFPGCGSNVMFVIVDSVNKEPVFVRSSDETLAFVPQTMNAEDLCWNPDECDAVFYISSETPKLHMTYDNGTKGYSTNTLISVLFPKDRTVWGPVTAYHNNPPKAVSGAGVAVDNYALFEYLEGVFYATAISDIPAYTIIELSFVQRCFYIEPDKLKDDITWQGFEGMVLEDEQGDTLEFYLDEQSRIRGRFTSASDDISDYDIGIIYGNGAAHSTDVIDKGRIYSTTGSIVK